MMDPALADPDAGSGVDTADRVDRATERPRRTAGDAADVGPSAEPSANRRRRRTPPPAARRAGRPFGFLRRSRPGTVGLRRRILLIFTLGSLALSAFLAITTYGLVRSNLAAQRDSASLQAAYTHAQVVQSALRSEPETFEPAHRPTPGPRGPASGHPVQRRRGPPGSDGSAPTRSPSRWPAGSTRRRCRRA